MINFSIELGDGDVAVGMTKLNIREGEVQYGLSFRDLVHPEEIGTPIEERGHTRNFLAVTVKNKESYLVLKRAVDQLGEILEKGRTFEEVKADYEKITGLIKEEIAKEKEDA